MTHFDHIWAEVYHDQVVASAAGCIQPLMIRCSEVKAVLEATIPWHLQAHATILLDLEVLQGIIVEVEDSQVEEASVASAEGRRIHLVASETVTSSKKLNEKNDAT
jgi:hypothetical protein